MVVPPAVKIQGKLLKMAPYERFQAWQIAHQLALEIYRTTDHWPPQERYELTRQLRRAALSAPANIAEGAAKRGTREFRRFLDNPRLTLRSLLPPPIQS